MVLKCDIHFDQNENGVYFAGQLLSGNVTVNLNKTKKLKAICLHITGRAQCGWTEQHSVGAGKQRRTQTIHYRGQEDYVSTSTYLVPGSVVGEGFDLLAGTHRYTFACALPARLPTSFEGTRGHIRYTVKVILERPWKFDHTHQVAFTVLQQLNLNYLSPELRIPTQMEFTKFFCCGPCRSAPLSIVASVPQTGYVPGQTIIISASVVNDSNVDIKAMKYSLMKTVIYHSQTPAHKTKHEVTVIQENRGLGVAKRTKETCQVALMVPPVPPSNENLSRIIHIQYELKIEATAAGAHTSPSVVIPITIGTVPLTRIATAESMTPSILAPQPLFNEIMPSAPQIDTSGSGDQQTRGVGGASAFHWVALDTDPPSYEEATEEGRQQAVDTDDDQANAGEPSFAPRYPVFSFHDGPSYSSSNQHGAAAAHAVGSTNLEKY